jgi:hypothetical protein
MKKIFLLFQMFLVACAEPERTLLQEESHKNHIRFHPVDTQKYLHMLLDSRLEGEALLKAYDAHYDSMSPPDQLREKNQYPDNVYADLLAHRRSLFKFKK